MMYYIYWFWILRIKKYVDFQFSIIFFQASICLRIYKMAMMGRWNGGEDWRGICSGSSVEELVVEMDLSELFFFFWLKMIFFEYYLFLNVQFLMCHIKRGHGIPRVFGCITCSLIEWRKALKCCVLLGLCVQLAKSSIEGLGWQSEPSTRVSQGIPP